MGKELNFMAIRLALSVLIFLVAHLCSCDTRKNVIGKNEFLYLGLGTSCDSFDKNIPSFGGVEWDEPMQVLIDEQLFLLASNGGISKPVMQFNESSVITFHRNQSEEIIYVMVFLANEKGETKVLWKKILTGEETSISVNLLTGSSLY